MDWFWNVNVIENGDLLLGMENSENGEQAPLKTVTNPSPICHMVLYIIRSTLSALQCLFAIAYVCRKLIISNPINSTYLL